MSNFFSKNSFLTRRKTARRISVIGLTAAVYVVMTLAFPILSYGEVQCRLSEILNLLAFVNPVFAPGVVLGCFLANLFSPNGMLIDCVMGTSATLLAVIFIVKFSKNLFIASLWPTIFSIIIGVELCLISELPFTIINFVSLTFFVLVGEFIAVTVIGYPLFKQFLKNKYISDLLKSF